MFNAYTDLALEAHNLLAAKMATGMAPAAGTIPGVHVQEQQLEHAKVTRVDVMTPQAALEMGKAMGRYITIDAPQLRQRNRQLQNAVARTLTDELAALMNLNPYDQVLVVGLGNWNATPDALGPKVVSSLLVTRHLHRYVPRELVGHLRGVAAIAPGVLGLTGIETGDIVAGVVQRIQPRAVICIDALAARSVERIATTIQLADTGISPGAGVGNMRAGINEETLGLPVYAVGVPTVVHATTIATDTLEGIAQRLGPQHPAGAALEQMDYASRHQMVREVLSPLIGDLIVTPKEIDLLITDMARIVAGAINAALHPGISQEEIDQYLN